MGPVTTTVLGAAACWHKSFRKRIITPTIAWPQNFPRGSDSKVATYNAGDLGSIPGSGRSPGEGNGNPLQYSCLGWRSLVGYSPWGPKEWDTIEQLHFHFQTTGREHSPTHQQNIGLKIYWAWPCPPEQDPVLPTANPSHQEASTSLLFSSIRGETEWKQQSQKTNQTYLMDHRLV